MGNSKWIQARFTSQCRGCRQPVKKGESVLWFPRMKAVECHNCATESVEDNSRRAWVESHENAYYEQIERNLGLSEEWYHELHLH